MYVDILTPNLDIIDGEPDRHVSIFCLSAALLSS